MERCCIHNMLKKSIIVMVILSLFAVIVGCSKKEAEEDTIKEITIAIYPQTEYKRAIVAAKEKFELENKNVKVNIEQIDYRLYRPSMEKRYVEGNPPDIMITQPEEIVDYINNDMVMDLNSFLNQDNIDRDATFYNFIMEANSVGGKLSSIPMTSETWIVIYNEKRFQDAGIPEPTGDWTWEEFADVAQRLKVAYGGETGFTPVMMPFEIFLLENFIQSNGGSLLSEDGLTAQGYLNSDASVGAIQWVVDFITKDKLARPEFFGDIISAFRNQSARLNQSALFVMPTSFRSNVPLDQGYKATGLPYFSSGGRVNTVDAAGIGISTKSKNPQEAWAFIKEFTINDSSVTQNMIQDAMNNTKLILDKYGDDSISKAMTNEFQYVRSSSRFKNRSFYTINSTKISPALRKLISDANNGVDVSVKDALTDLARQMEDDLRSENYIPMP